MINTMYIYTPQAGSAFSRVDVRHTGAAAYPLFNSAEAPLPLARPLFDRFIHHMANAEPLPLALPLSARSIHLAADDPLPLAMPILNMAMVPPPPGRIPEGRRGRRLEERALVLQEFAALALRGISNVDIPNIIKVLNHVEREYVSERAKPERRLARAAGVQVTRLERHGLPPREAVEQELAFLALQGVPDNEILNIKNVLNTAYEQRERARLRQQKVRRGRLAGSEIPIYGRS